MFYTIKRYGIVFLFVVVIIIGLFFFRNDRSEVDLESAAIEENPVLQMVEAEDEDDDMDDNDTDMNVNLMVDIKGAVQKPGVYELSAGARVVDVIDIAGGFSSQALDTEINLAQKLEDEMVIYVPKQGEVTEETAWIQSSNKEQSDPNLVKINDATEEELTTLNGIGPSKAQAIISYREEHGPFQTVEDVLSVNGIGEKTLDQFKDNLIVP